MYVSFGTWNAITEYEKNIKYGKLESLLTALQKLYIMIKPRAYPTVASYNASVVKIYSAVNSMARF
jgi:hypothetical protein